VESGKIGVEHCSPEGEILQIFKGNSVCELNPKIMLFISLIEHRIYLGSELQKAETALKLGISYNQDQPLSY